MNKNDFSRILPLNLKKYKNIEAISSQFLEVLDKNIIPELNNISLYLNSENLRDEILDELAWQWNVEFYTSELPKSKKIELIKNSYVHHQKKGTVGVLESALKTLIGDIRISEFDEYQGKPFTFRLVSAENVPPNGDLSEMKRMIETFKNVRSSLDKILFVKEDKNITKTFSTQHIAGRIINYPRKEG